MGMESDDLPDSTPAVGSNAKQIAQAAAKGGRAYQPVLALDDTEMAEIVAQAKAWADDPSTLPTWGLENFLVVMQLIKKVATSMPAGRGGPNAMLRAAKMFAEMTERAMQLAEMAAEAKKASVK